MNVKYLQNIIAASVILFAGTLSYAGNIDPVNKFAWGENTGWVNFAPTGKDGVTVTDTTVSGMAWSENMGWVNLSPSGQGGVMNDGDGNLSGYAWSENCGWLNFTGVVIDPATGIFSGYAWGENIGWIRFFTEGSAKTVATIWRQDGDINGDGKLDLADAILSLQISVNIDPAENVYNSADVNGNGRIGLEEAIYSLQVITGLVDSKYLESTWEGPYESTTPSTNGTMTIQLPDPIPEGSFSAFLSWQDTDGGTGEGTINFIRNNNSIIGAGEISNSYTPGSNSILTFISGSISIDESSITGEFTEEVSSGLIISGSYSLQKEI